MIIFWHPAGVCKQLNLFCLSLCNLLAHIRLPYIRWKGTSIALIWGIVAFPTPRIYRDMAWGSDPVNLPSYTLATLPCEGECKWSRRQQQECGKRVQEHLGDCNVQRKMAGLAFHPLQFMQWISTVHSSNGMNERGKFASSFFAISWHACSVLGWFVREEIRNCSFVW